MKKRYIVDQHFCTVTQYEVVASSLKEARRIYRADRFGSKELNTDVCRAGCRGALYVTLDPDQAALEGKP